jgi:hypothetical protein
MDEIQEQHERAIGEAFIGWYNQQNGTRFVYHGRPREAPDLIYRDGERQRGTLRGCVNRTKAM